MRKSTLFLMAVSLVMWSITGMAQLKPIVPKVKKDYKALKPGPVPKDDWGPSIKPVNQTVTSKSVLDDTVLMVTRYDLQTNSSVQTRNYLYSDGTIGTTCMMSHADNFLDRGTGYNYLTERPGGLNLRPGSRMKEPAGRPMLPSDQQVRSL